MSITAAIADEHLLTIGERTTSPLYYTSAYTHYSAHAESYWLLLTPLLAEEIFRNITARNFHH